MVIIGLAFLLTWLEVTVFNLELLKSLLITAIVFIILGLVLGERPFLKG